MGVRKHFFFFNTEGGGGEHQHDPVAPVVAPVIDTGNELVEPVIDHTEKITRIEERQAQHQEEMMRELRALEERLVTATSGQVAGIEERIARLETRIEENAEVVPEENVELDLPDVEESPAPPEKIRQGLSHRRKAKRKAKK